MANNTAIRRNNLLAKDPHCYWCHREVRACWIGGIDQPKPPPDMATLDHLNSRNQHRNGRPQLRTADGEYATASVLACFECNQARGTAEQHGEEWHPPDRTGQ